MRRKQCENNLKRMKSELRAYLASNRITPGKAGKASASKIAKAIFLAHSTTDEGFAGISSSTERLLSPRGLDERGIKALKPTAVEITLGTDGDVFLYAAPFSFPSSCGFLFDPGLEKRHKDDGFAAPFDSGGLIKIYGRPDMAEPAVDFLRRHELPLSEHRQYLKGSIESLFKEPADYLDRVPPCHGGPIGLTGGDCRRWTHEVRIPDEVLIKTGSLQAVFVPERAALIPKFEPLLNWCESEGFDVEIYESDGSNVFDNLQRLCIDYVRRELL